jgi:hypothetical protein
MCSILHIQKSKYQKLYKKAHEKSVFLLSLEKNLDISFKTLPLLRGEFSMPDLKMNSYTGI